MGTRTKSRKWKEESKAIPHADAVRSATTSSLGSSKEAA